MPGLKWGGDSPSRIYLGNQQINRIYHGQQIVWPEFTASGPLGCWVPVFQSLPGTVPRGHPHQCRDDLGTVGINTILNPVGQSSSSPYGFDDRVRQYEGGVQGGELDYGIVAAPPLDQVGDLGFMTTFQYDTSTNGSGLTMKVRSANRLDADISHFTSDFYNDGYILIFADWGGGFRIIYVLKASYGSQPSDATISFSIPQLIANSGVILRDAMAGHAETFDNSSFLYFTEDGTYVGSPDDAVYATDLRDDLVGATYLSVSYLSHLNALRDFRYVDEFEVGGTEPLPAIYFGRPWSTYGTGELCRFLVGRTAGGVGGEGAAAITNGRIYDPNDSSNSDVVLGDLEVDSSFTIGLIRWVAGSKRIILRKSSDSPVNLTTWANGTGANKSLYVICRGHMVELNFNFSQGFTGSDLPDYNVPITSTADYIRWDFSNTAAANNMESLINGYLAGNGYQMLFVIADSGTVQGVNPVSLS